MPIPKHVEDLGFHPSMPIPALSMTKGQKNVKSLGRPWIKTCSQLGVSGNLWPPSVILKCLLIILNPSKHNLTKHALVFQEAAQNNKEHRLLPCGLGLYHFKVDPQVISYNFCGEGRDQSVVLT